MNRQKTSICHLHDFFSKTFLSFAWRSRVRTEKLPGSWKAQEGDERLRAKKRSEALRRYLIAVPLPVSTDSWFPSLADRTHTSKGVWETGWRVEGIM